MNKKKNKEFCKKRKNYFYLKTVEAKTSLPEFCSTLGKKANKQKKNIKKTFNLPFISCIVDDL